jgi:hypothetical protein
MLDTLGYVTLVLCAPLAIATILTSLPASRGERLVIGGILVGWFIFTAVAPRSGALAGIVLPVVLFPLLLTLSTKGRRLLAGATIAPLIGLHVTRLVGGLFILLHAEGRLANPFAAIAGWGDILSAVLAVPAAILAYRAREGWQNWVLAWNGIGTIDFITAVFLGATSQVGTPIRIFFEAPGAALLGELPWRFIPAYFVPLYLVIHVVLFVRLWPFGRIPRS